MNYNNFINKDLRKRYLCAEKRHPRLRWGVLAAGSILIGAVIAHTPESEPESSVQAELLNLEKSLSNNTSFSRLSQPLVLPDNPLSPVAISDFEDKFENWQTIKIKSGDNLSTLFDRAKIKASQLIEFMQLKNAVKHLLKIHPGEVIKLNTDDDGILTGLHYDINLQQSLLVERINNALQTTTIEHNITARPHHATGVIDDSLFMAAQKAGLNDNMTMELAAIFGWDIDFVLDIRKGDSFSVIYNEIYKNGIKIKNGNILTAEFINKGKSYRAVRYEDPKTHKIGYFTDSGRNMRKAFLRSPVKFSYISSKFTSKRYHPVLHKFRSHKGVDYAARRGTPIRSAGEGKIIYRGNKGGYGKVVIVQHGSRYSTLYAHLSNFDRKARKGRRVKQGQVIGYVGSSGLATGAHLHYEFRVNGVHRNPLTVRFPSAKAISRNHLARFKEETAHLFAQLDVLNRNQLALNQ
ncbi:MAG: peptidoglycan DD-metalloendopeptidase family protein [Gammaproteobacteria bacterium]|nr:peptidoglycan DD-metalloendopeptidase family protein [Gammaproteobacteria bacterium]